MNQCPSEKLTDIQLIMKLPAVYGSGQFITSFTTASPIPILIHINPVHGSTLNFLKAHFNIIPPSMPSSSKWHLSSGLPIKALYTTLLYPTRATWRARLPVHLISRIIFVDKYSH